MRQVHRSPLASPPRILGVAIGLVVAGALALASPASASYGRPSGTTTKSPSVAIPLTGSVTTSSTVFVAVAMGKNENFNLFWELFSLDSGTDRFTLITPPGVADNGGLMVAADSAGPTALIGIGTSQGLAFSPLAMTTNSGRTWSQGGLTSGLSAVPSSLALGPKNAATALVTGDQQSVLVRSGSLTSWKTLVTKKTLGATSGGVTCGITALGAVDIDPSGIMLVGASCRRPDAPGVFVDDDAGWHLADIPVPRGLVEDSFGILRLGTTGHVTDGLLAATHNTTNNLLAAWETSTSRPWVLSPALALRTGDRLVASGTGTGTTQFVLIRSKGSLRAETIAGPGASWHELPTLPEGTATLAFAPDGRLDALVVNDKHLTCWQLGTNGHGWRKIQSLTVPIAFGSSS